MMTAPEISEKVRKSTEISGKVRKSPENPEMTVNFRARLEF